MMAKKKDRKWMQKAFAKNKGALKNELGVSPGKTIPAEKLATKKGDSLRTKRRKNLAKTASKIAKKRKKGG
jgi:hypothetical protein